MFAAKMSPGLCSRQRRAAPSRLSIMGWRLVQLVLRVAREKAGAGPSMMYLPRARRASVASNLRAVTARAFGPQHHSPANPADHHDDEHGD